MSGVNKVTLLGRLGADPESRKTNSGDTVVNFSLATSEKWTDKESGEKKEQTEWHRVIAFKRTAEIIQQYVKKGDQIYVEGKLQTRKWQDKNGQDRYTTEVVVRDMQLLGGKGESGSSQKQLPPPPEAVPENLKDFDKDIPF